MPPHGPSSPEALARVKIDAALQASGWIVQDRDDMNVAAGPGVAVRELKLKAGHGFADCLLFVDGKAAGVLEAKPEGFSLSGVEPQAKKYAEGLPASLDPPVTPLPFLSISNGAATSFTNLLDRKPRSRRIFQIHRPETLRDWLAADPLDAWVKALHEEGSGFYTASDRSNLGEQAEKEFQGYRTPDDRRKLTELYKVQRLTSNTIGASSKVVITTIQRLYSMLKGEPELDPALEDGTQFGDSHAPREPLPVVYSPTWPPEYFDVIYIDECHRSIYSIWRQVLEYFDAYLVGLTATPASHTFGFFHKNLVMQYPHERAVADGVNVQFFVYKIRTKITEEGSTIEAGEDTLLKVRLRAGEKWLKPDEDITYKGSDLDNSVVAPDQIRTVVRAFRDRVRSEIFPGRKHVPKTLVFAKDDQHAEDIVGIIRDEFGEGNDFCQKITYKTTGRKPADLIQDFRTGFYPRIAVTVDMIATGTDIRPIEIVWFMRAVGSRVLFEQMKGRGVRVVDKTELVQVSPDAQAKNPGPAALVDARGAVARL